MNKVIGIKSSPIAHALCAQLNCQNAVLSIRVEQSPTPTTACRGGALLRPNTSNKSF